MLKTRIFHLTLAVVVAFLGLVLFSTTMGAMAAPLSPNTGPKAMPQANNGNMEIRALRAISIPFGITDTLSLSADGSQITVIGHGEGAWPGVFKIEAIVTQDSTQAVAYGQANGHLSGQGVRVQWQTDADVLGDTAFQPETAHVYATATVIDPPNHTTVYQWDKDVTLTTGGY